MEEGQSTRQALQQEYEACDLVKPFRYELYEPGHQLEYNITGVVPANTGKMVAEVEKFVGGGFAGQVYRVKLLELKPTGDPIVGLEVGETYAIKVLKPASGFSCAFRDLLFLMGYQGNFSAQVNPHAVRVGVLWQKLIRRAAATRFGEDTAVCDTYATFYDDNHKSFGEINEWITGRVWKFEVDDELFTRWDFKGKVPADHNSPEYVQKKRFMQELVAMLHEMGAPELARQYEWWTCKSQPNALKRVDADDDPAAGLTAVDFRAGLALLPFLPMSPADPFLILRGLVKGRIVQFDRSDPVRFKKFIEDPREDFEDLRPAVEELAEQEPKHRASLPDVTHHHFRLLWNRDLQRGIKEGAITAWRNLGRIDDLFADRLRSSSFLFLFFYCVSWIPFFGRAFLKFCGNKETRTHYLRAVTSFSYGWRAMRGSRIMTLIKWHRNERISDERALKLVRRPVRYWMQRLALSWLPAKWHRSFIEWGYGWQRFKDAVSFGVKFLRVPSFREEWLVEQVELGRREGMLSDEEADKIAGSVSDPYIQKYLRCLAVHMCTVPVTQIVMVVAFWGVAYYVNIIEQRSWQESLALGSAAAVGIQLLPISPGSTTRGLFVLYLMIKERDIKNYYVAAPVSFIHVIGYLAFPMQMVAHDPTLARFLAGRWAKNLVHAVPVFGESGALLEHAVFDIFFNLPLTIRRGFRTNPLRWVVGSSLIAAGIAAVVLAAYVRVWEWRQPEEQLRAVRVASIVPYEEESDLHWSLDGMRVHFDGRPEPVDYPATNWNASVSVDDNVNAVIRKSFFGNEYDGLQIGTSTAAATSTSSKTL